MVAHSEQAAAKSEIGSMTTGPSLILDLVHYSII